jgi:acyl-CoA reductase-like NAD-dependent aldehyde dehydrogenase
MIWNTVAPHVETIRCRNFVAGRWEADEGSEIRRVNPADVRDLVAVAPDSSAATVRRAIQAVAAAAEAWRRLIPPERGRIVLRAARLMEARGEDLARLITREEGKVIAESRAEVRRAVDIMEYVSGMGRRLGGHTLPSEVPGVFCYTLRQPIGPVAVITPWNFPVAIPCWKIAPALVCGNPVVFKPSPLTPATAVAVVEIFLEAGLPPETIALVHGGADVGTALADHPSIAGISFTGSTKVGTAIHAAAARRLAKTQLEMGGKNPQIVLRDADLALAVDCCLTAAFGSTGQRCTATSRAIVERAVAERFTARLVERARSLRVGPGDAPDVEIGPLVDEPRLRDVEGYVDRAVRAGGCVLTGGGVPEGLAGGYYYPPTVVAGVAPEHEIAQEEVFGPVLSVIEAGDPDEALRVANAVRYGLCASIFTQDLGRALRLVDAVEAGMVHVNRPGLGGFSHFPFGGLKHSSYGAREVGDDTIGFYTDLKSVYINQA